MQSVCSLLLLLLAVAGCRGCNRASTPATTPAPTTTERAPVVEEHLSANTAATQERGNAWATGGGIDWTHVGRGGQGNSNRGSSSSSSSSSSSASSSRGGSSSNSGSTVAVPSSPQPVSRNDLKRFSEQVFSQDVNAVGSQVTLNMQGRTSSRNSVDNAPQNLMSRVSPSALEGPTIAPLWALLDNYSPQVTQREHDTQQELQEQNAFLAAVSSTAVMRSTEDFLRGKGLISAPLREVLREIWFTPYPRSRRTMGSSGFEHVFVGELKDGQVSGFHNWLSFYKEEQEGDLDYFGYMKTVELGPQAQIVLLRFNWEQDTKPVGSMFIGTSPELDMALYTVCFFARPGMNCPMEINGHRFNIKTHYQNYKGKRYVGTAFPNI